MMNETKTINRTRLFIRILIGVCILFGFLFGYAGRWDYWQGWLFFAVNVLYMAAMASFFRKHKDLLRERMKPGPGTKWWDRVFYALYIPASYGIIIVGAFDSGRYGWTGDFPILGYVFGYFLYLGSLCAIRWIMKTNNFFSSTVRIQSDRGHTVVQDGPYAYIRHPGYVSAMSMMAGISLCLGSLYALIPTAFVIVLFVVRTALEDATLHNELEGYKEYAQKVKYRLIPGVW